MTGNAAELREAARRAVAPLLDRLVAHSEVEGVVYLSSFARHGLRDTFDEESDVDVIVYLDVPVGPDEWLADSREYRRRLASRLPRWLPDFSFHVGVPWGIAEINLHQRIYQYDADPRTVWDEPIREAHAYTCEVAYDRSGRIRELIRRKIQRDPAQDRDRITRLRARLSWDCAVLPLRQLRRGEVTAGHLLVNDALNEIVELVFVLNGRYLPHRRWWLHTIRSEKLLGGEDLDLLIEAMTWRSAQGDDLIRRVELTEELCRRVYLRLPPDQPTDAYAYYSAELSSNRQLLRRTVADELADRGQEQGWLRDAANYLLADSPDDPRLAWLLERHGGNSTSHPDGVIWRDILAVGARSGAESRQESRR